MSSTPLPLTDLVPREVGEKWLKFFREELPTLPPCPPPLTDLVPREVGEKWLKFFREELPTVAFKCSTQQQAEKLGRRKMPASSKVVDDGSSSGLQVRGWGEEGEKCWG